MSHKQSTPAAQPGRSLGSDEDSDLEQPKFKDIPLETVTIAIFCALACEAVAVKYSFDEEFTCRTKAIGPKRDVYSFGRIGNHIIVVARPTQMDTVKAAQCATRVNQQFPNVQFALTVGVGAGIPAPPQRDIRLGDVAVSVPNDNHPGVIQYDFGKYEVDGFVLKGVLDKPPLTLISAVASLEEDEMMRRSPLRRILRGIVKRSGFARPTTEDILFDESFHHLDERNDCSGCEVSSEKKTVPRAARHNKQPLVHRGLILSGNDAVKSSQDSNRLRRGHHGAICLETAAGGILDEIPCLVIRGICDYADSHKQDGWRHYAAAVAAAYCKTILSRVDSEDVDETSSVKDLVSEGMRPIMQTQRQGIDIHPCCSSRCLTQAAPVGQSQSNRPLPNPTGSKRKRQHLEVAIISCCSHYRMNSKVAWNLNLL
ncbi:nucleoside phosphorylase domain-containing protein [Aspergillus californicus]